MSNLPDDIRRFILEIKTSSKSEDTIRELKKLEANTAALVSRKEDLRRAMAVEATRAGKNTEMYKKLQREYKKTSSQIRANREDTRGLTEMLGLSYRSMKQLKAKSKELTNQLSQMSKRANPEAYRKLKEELDRVNATIRQEADPEDRFGSLRDKAKKAIPAIKAFLAAFVIERIVSMSKELYELSKQMQGESIRSATVFGKELGYVQDEASKVAEKIGVTTHQFTTMAAATADLLVPLGMSRVQAAKMSVEVQGLVGPLDEWTAGTKGAAEISDILTKAMLGEMEQLKGLGIAIAQDSNEFRNLTKKIRESNGVTNGQAKAMATLQLLYNKSADARNAYEQGGAKMYRTEKKLYRIWQNMKETIAGATTLTPIKQLEKQRLAMNNLAIQATQLNEGDEKRAEILNKLASIYPKYYGEIDAATTSNKELLIVMESVNKQMIAQIHIATRKEGLALKQEKAAEALGIRQSSRSKFSDTVTEIGDKMNEQDRAELISNVKENIKNNLEEIEKEKKKHSGFMVYGENLKSEKLNEVFPGIKYGDLIKLTNGYESLTEAKETYLKLEEEAKTEAIDISNEAISLGIKPDKKTDDTDPDFTSKKNSLDNQYKAEKLHLLKTYKNKEEHSARSLAAEAAYYKDVLLLQTEYGEDSYDTSVKLAELKIKAQEELLKQLKKGLSRKELEKLPSYSMLAKEAKALDPEKSVSLNPELVSNNKLPLKQDQTKLDLSRDIGVLSALHHGTTEQADLDFINDLFDKKLLSEEEYFQARIEIRAKYDEKDKLNTRQGLGLEETEEQEQLKQEDPSTFAIQQKQIEIAKVKELLDQGVINEAEAARKINEITKGSAEERLAKTTQMFQLGMQAASEASSLISTLEQNKLDAVEEKVSLGLISEEEGEKQKLAIQKDAADKELAIKISQIIASTGLAIMQTTGQMGALPAAAVIPFIVASGAMQLATAVAERQSVKQLAKGKYDVVGADDNRYYNNVPFVGAPKSGVYDSPTLISEYGGETVLTADHTQRLMQMNPRLMNEVMNYRHSVPQRASGSYPNLQTTQSTANTTTPSPENKETKLLISLLSNLSKNGIKATVPEHGRNSLSESMDRISRFNKITRKQ